MNSIEFLQAIAQHAKNYRPDAIMSIHRNSHMHQCSMLLDQEEVDAVLTDFINHIGMRCGVDFGMYSSDLNTPQP